MSEVIGTFMVSVGVTVTIIYELICMVVISKEDLQEPRIRLKHLEFRVMNLRVILMGVILRGL